jgi:thiol-disulfide isomerase/thioredoxin
MRILVSLLLAAWTLSAQSAPKVIKIDDAGYRKLISSGAGKVTLVNFWATWCGPCKKEMPELLKMSQRLGGGFRLVLVSADEVENQAQVASYLKGLGYSGVVYLRPLEDAEGFINSVDPKWGGGLPASIVYGKTGNKIKLYTGEIPFRTAEPELKKLL